MKIMFVRHGEADFGVVNQRGYIGMGRQFAPLTELGKEQANKVASNFMLSHSEISFRLPIPAPCKQPRLLLERPV